LLLPKNLKIVVPKVLKEKKSYRNTSGPIMRKVTAAQHGGCTVSPKA
jgi:hypothetical protein